MARPCCCSSSSSGSSSTPVENTATYEVIQGIGSSPLPLNVKGVSVTVIQLGAAGSVTIDSGSGAVPMFQGQTVNVNVLGSNDELTGTFTIETSHADDIVSIVYLF